MARQRFDEWGLVDMAVGHDDPMWPLPSTTPKFADWSFAGGRPFNCNAGKCERWHAGIDLVNARGAALVVAPERMEIVGVDKGWKGAAKQVTARTETGLFLVFGGVKAKSGDEWGIKPGVVVEADDPIGRVLGSYKMIHFETYQAEHLDVVREANTPWPVGQPPPPGLLNPLNYIERAAGVEPTLANWHQRRAALRELGFGPNDSGVWGDADVDALIEVQALLDQKPDVDLEADGIWGPKTDAAIRAALGSGSPLIKPASKPAPQPLDRPTNGAKTGDRQDAPPEQPGLGWRDFVAPALITAALFAGYRWRKQGAT